MTWNINWFRGQKEAELAKKAITERATIANDYLKLTKKEHFLDVIQKGESKFIEFKSSLRYCPKTLKPEKHVEFSSIKNIAAFLNTEGGTLFIGIDDKGEIMGLEATDFKTFNGDNKVDEFLKYFDNLIAKYIGNDKTSDVSIVLEKIEDKTIAILKIKHNTIGPTILTNKSKVSKDEFYIRRNASAIPLSMNEFFTYSKEKWK